MGTSEWAAMLKRLHQKQVANLVPLIGDEAAHAAVRENSFGAFGWVCCALVALPCGLLAESGVGLAWIPAAIAATVGLISFAFLVTLDRRSARMASAHVSAELGYQVRLQAMGWKPSKWRSAIEKVRREHESSSSQPGSTVP